MTTMIINNITHASICVWKRVWERNNILDFTNTLLVSRSQQKSKDMICWPKTILKILLFLHTILMLPFHYFRLYSDWLPEYLKESTFLVKAELKTQYYVTDRTINFTWLSIHFKPTAVVHSFLEALLNQSRL